MVTRRDRWLLIMLMLNAAVNAVTSSAYLVEIADRTTVAVIGLVSAALSAATGVYVVSSRETQGIPSPGIVPGQRSE
jgi:hypothetical protein